MAAMEASASADWRFGAGGSGVLAPEGGGDRRDYSDFGEQTRTGEIELKVPVSTVAPTGCASNTSTNTSDEESEPEELTTDINLKEAAYREIRETVRSAMPVVAHPWDVASIASVSICASRGEAPSRSEYFRPATQVTSLPPKVVANAQSQVNMAAEMFMLSPSPSRFLEQQQAAAGAALPHPRQDVQISQSTPVQPQVTEIFSMSPSPSALLERNASRKAAASDEPTPVRIATPRKKDPETDDVQVPEERHEGMLYSNGHSPMSSSCAPKFSIRARTRENGEPLEYFMLDYVGKQSSDGSEYGKHISDGACGGSPVSQQESLLDLRRQFKRHHSEQKQRPGAAAALEDWGEIQSAREFSFRSMTPCERMPSSGHVTPISRIPGSGYATPKRRYSTEHPGMRIWEAVQQNQARMASVAGGAAVAAAASAVFDHTPNLNGFQAMLNARAGQIQAAAKPVDMFEAEVRKQFEGVRKTCEERIAAFARRVERMKVAEGGSNTDRMDAFKRRKERAHIKSTRLEPLADAPAQEEEDENNSTKVQL